jgi:hypothetical protein
MTPVVLRFYASCLGALLWQIHSLFLSFRSNYFVLIAIVTGCALVGSYGCSVESPASVPLYFVVEAPRVAVERPGPYALASRDIVA